MTNLPAALTPTNGVRSLHAMEGIWRWVGAAAAACLLITGCGAGTEADRSTDSAEADHGAAAPQATAEHGQEGAAEDSGSGSQAESAADTEPAVITNASAAVEVDDPEAAVQEVLDHTSSYDGHVEHRRQSTDEAGNPQRAALTLRLPADHLPKLLEDLTEVGDVSEISESARDVSGTVRDLDARIEALQVSVDRLVEILSEVESAEELLQVETTLSERQADLEALEARRNDLSDQIAMSTLEVQLSTEPITEVEADGFLGGLRSGFDSVVSVANVLMVAAGAALPWLAVAAVPGVVAVLLIRRRRQAIRRGAADAAQPPDSAGSPG